MTELSLNKENLNDTIQTILNLIGNQLVLDSDNHTVCPLGTTWRENRFTLGDYTYTMAFDGHNYFSLHINTSSKEVM